MPPSAINANLLDLIDIFLFILLQSSIYLFHSLSNNSFKRKPSGLLRALRASKPIDVVLQWGRSLLALYCIFGVQRQPTYFSTNQPREDLMASKRHRGARLQSSSNITPSYFPLQPRRVRSRRSVHNMKALGQARPSIALMESL